MDVGVRVPARLPDEAEPGVAEVTKTLARSRWWGASLPVRALAAAEPDGCLVTPALPRLLSRAALPAEAAPVVAGADGDTECAEECAPASSASAWAGARPRRPPPRPRPRGARPARLALARARPLRRDAWEMTSKCRVALRPPAGAALGHRQAPRRAAAGVPGAPGAGGGASRAGRGRAVLPLIRGAPTPQAAGVCRAWRSVAVHVTCPATWRGATDADWASPGRLLVPVRPFRPALPRALTCIGRARWARR